MERLIGYTEDGLRLPAYFYGKREDKVCVVFIHGMNGNIDNNFFADVWGELLSRNNISFLFGYTRGYSLINRIQKRDGTYLECGTAFEIFEESFYDVSLWVEKVKVMGYEKIVLLGHSLGCNKVINYLFKSNNFIDGLILASPPDMLGLIKNDYYQKNYEELIKEAEDNIRNNKEDKLLSTMLWEEYFISSKTLINYIQEGSDIDNLPVARNPNNFIQLEKIKIPILAFMGSLDDIVIRSIEDDLELIKNKALACSNFKTKIFDGANHLYDGVEEEIGLYLIKWINENI